MPNPNALAAGGSGGTAVIILLLARKLLGLGLTAEEGAAIAIALASGFLWLGHEGIKGLLRHVWSGDRP